MEEGEVKQGPCHPFTAFHLWLVPPGKALPVSGDTGACAVPYSTYEMLAYSLWTIDQQTISLMSMPKISEVTTEHSGRQFWLTLQVTLIISKDSGEFAK